MSDTLGCSSTEGSLRKVTDVKIKNCPLISLLDWNLVEKICIMLNVWKFQKSLIRKIVHPECYKKFACAKTLLKKWKSDDENRSSKQLKTSKNEETIAWSAKGSQLKLMVKNSWLKIF